MSERDPLDEMEAFFAQVRSRMEAGRKTYGDKSFGLEAPVLVGELEAEALDLAGWGFVLWHRLRRLREATERAEAEDAARRAEALKDLVRVTEELGLYDVELPPVERRPSPVVSRREVEPLVIVEPRPCSCGGGLVADGQTRCYHCRVDAGEIPPMDIAAVFSPRSGALR